MDDVPSRTTAWGFLSNDENSDDAPPTPPPKDLPTSHLKYKHAHVEGYATIAAPTPTTEADPLVRPYPISRAGSIYSLSRISFSSQISQLTSLQLPDAPSLAASIQSIASAANAVRSLKDSADQIQRWIQKASDVLGGLDSGDDVEWAAAAGRDGLSEIDQAIERFEQLIQVYISSVEAVQSRNEGPSISAQEMTPVVDRIEKISTHWLNVKESLRKIKREVELAMEWEELRRTVLTEISDELEDLTRAVFEMEERRHQASSETVDVGNFDIGDIETLMSEGGKPGRNSRPTSGSFARFNITPAMQTPPLPSPAIVAEEEEDTYFMGLFARMQPLRASLDFLPMRLSSFQLRGKDVFPSACDDLRNSANALEEQWKRLEADVESLRSELGEDRWIRVFKSVGKQALKMIDSVARSITKVDESLSENTRLQHSPATLKKIENYDVKKIHYLPAIERVLSIVDRGVKGRLTVNGGIVRLQAEIHQRWQSLQISLKNMDILLQEYKMNATVLPTNEQQLRDSLSSILSSEPSSTKITPGSSPASSIFVETRRDINSTNSPITSHNRLSNHPKLPKSNRHSSLPLPTRRTQQDDIVEPPPAESIPFYGPRSLVETSRKSSSPAASTPIKPRWNMSTNLNGTTIGHNFKPLSATTPSPYSKTSLSSRTTPTQTPSTQRSIPRSGRKSVRSSSLRPLDRCLQTPITQSVSTLQTPSKTTSRSSSVSPFPHSRTRLSSYGGTNSIAADGIEQIETSKFSTASANPPSPQSASKGASMIPIPTFPSSLSSSATPIKKL